MRIVIILFCIIIIACYAPPNNFPQGQSKCSNSKKDEQLKSLRELGDSIIIINPGFEKLTEYDNLKIDSLFYNKTNDFVSTLCPEIFDHQEFERFSLIYWYNVKYNQFKCCVPPESEIIPAIFFDENHYDYKTLFNVTLYHLLKKNNITKRDVSLNGFTQSSLQFTVSRSLFKNDPLLQEFIQKVDLTQRKSY